MIRIIPRLDIKGPNLVKGIHLEGLRVLGKPEEFARYYYNNGADELFYQDVVASLYRRNSLKEIIKKTARDIFIPLTIGGGIRSLNDIRDILRSGADKVSINTAAVKNPDFIKEASQEFGSSTIVVAIETIREKDGSFLIYTDNGREYTGIKALEWAKKVEKLGAGEIILTSVDREGTRTGFDIELTKTIAENLSIPVIAHGGAGSPKDIVEVISKGKVNAIAVASILHYDFVEKNKVISNYKEEGNIEFLKKRQKKENNFSLADIKNILRKKNIECRY